LNSNLIVRLGTANTCWWRTLHTVQSAAAAQDATRSRQQLQRYQESLCRTRYCCSDAVQAHSSCSSWRRYSCAGPAAQRRHYDKQLQCWHCCANMHAAAAGLHRQQACRCRPAVVQHRCDAADSLRQTAGATASTQRSSLQMQIPASLRQRAGSGSAQQQHAVACLAVMQQRRPVTKLTGS
jgi:hypothetical protein